MSCPCDDDLIPIFLLLLLGDRATEDRTAFNLIYEHHCLAILDSIMSRLVNHRSCEFSSFTHSLLFDESFPCCSSEAIPPLTQNPYSDLQLLPFLVISSISDDHVANRFSHRPSTDQRSCRTIARPNSKHIENDKASLFEFPQITACHDDTNDEQFDD
jgi:hypothetical protein